MRDELEYNMAAWLKAIAAVGLSLGSVVECSLMGIVWATGQKGRLELWCTVLMGLVRENLL